MPGGGGPAAAGAAAAAPADSLHAHLLAKIAAVVLAHAESALLVDGTNRCQMCQQHLHFRCVCLRGRRAGQWADITMERQIDDCVRGSHSAAWSNADALDKQGVAYREALLGTVQRMR